MPIEFLDLFDDHGWAPLAPDLRSTVCSWRDGATLADAPVDVAATFQDAAWRSTAIDRSFGLTGVRLRAGFRVPMRHHNAALQMIVFGGSVTVHTAESCEDLRERDSFTLVSGQFCVIDEDTPFAVEAGPDGVTYVRSWPLGSDDLTTCWHLDPAWVRRST